MNAKVSMDACISPNIAFVLSGFTSLKLTPVESDKIQECQPKCYKPAYLYSIDKASLWPGHGF